MSPTTFRQEVTYLLSELTRCYELCTAVRQNRRIGTKHEALDSLQDTIAASISALQIEYDTLRKLLGARMDVGDERSRHEINHSIRALSNEIRARLEDIAYKRDYSSSSDHGSNHSSSSRGHGPGFRDLLRKWTRIETDVEDTLQTLSHRLENPVGVPDPPKLERPSSASGHSHHHNHHQHHGHHRHSSKEKEKDEIVISMQDFDRYVAHMKKSWEEREVAGQVLYVNCFDESRTQWERPEGAFIRGLRRRGSWERVSPQVREDSWCNYTTGQGW